MGILSTNEEIYQTLEHDILSLRIKPGEFLSENQLCTRFDISRTPIRSVLQRLQTKELVHVIPHKGTQVTLLDFNIVNQMIYQRLAVESMVLRDYIRQYSPIDLEIVRHAQQILTDIYEEEKNNENFDYDKFLEADMKMHEIWFKSTGKMYLWENIRRTQSSYSRFCILDMIETHNYEHVVHQHSKILELIENKNVADIEALLELHLYGGVRRLGQKIFTIYKDYFINL